MPKMPHRENTKKISKFRKLKCIKDKILLERINFKIQNTDIFNKTKKDTIKINQWAKSVKNTKCRKTT